MGSCSSKGGQTATADTTNKPAEQKTEDPAPSTDARNMDMSCTDSRGKEAAAPAEEPAAADPAPADAGAEAGGE